MVAAVSQLAERVVFLMGVLCCLEDERVGSQSLQAMTAVILEERPLSEIVSLRLSPGTPSFRH